MSSLTLPHAAPDSPGRMRRRLRLALVAGMFLGALGSAVVALPQVRQGVFAIALGTPAAPARETNIAAELVTTAGFQRRGNLLVGELRARDGRPIRLVLDAQSQALIGFRVLEAPPAPACPDAGATAPPPSGR